MTSRHICLKATAAAVLIGLAGASNAAITVYTTSATFATAVSSGAGPTGNDTFSDLTINTPVAGPLLRTTGAGGSSGAANIPLGYAGTPATGSSYNYRISTSPDGLYVIPSAGNPALTPSTSTDSITFDQFNGAIRGFAGNFFGSNQYGEGFSGAIKVVVSDLNSGTPVTRTISPSSLSAGFLGFVSDSMITSVVVSVGTQNASLTIWPSIDNVILAGIPEPGTYALLAAGLGVVGFVARRRRRA